MGRLIGLAGLVAASGCDGGWLTGNCAELIENSFGRSQIFRSPSHGNRDLRDKIVDTELTEQIGHFRDEDPAINRSFPLALLKLLFKRSNAQRAETAPTI